ncbi:multiple sugar transport system substrate-binding protein [Marinobacter gudaonensis]|uniref:Multiple sugar transport system substrate-binding protein n=1 Tax=Marinobacter gudaonensis TaxID=375760 RepID=A0A1I6G9Y2_9GAMM|nr:ABC transporter substrate-binding protein [Marinobacter gudaonensis]SFR39012.1 multiple sugar transport system substrate-binding protein [Marinobacter gudaonensis]
MNFRDALLFVCLFFGAASLLSAQEIRVSLQLQPNQRDKFEEIFQQFQFETGIKVLSVVETDLGYKRKVPVWLIEGKNTPDVMFWSASQRLYLYAEKGLILPITELWNTENYDEQFLHFKPGVTFNGQVYAIPFAYYHWGLFFRKSMIEEFGGAPEDWESFIAILSRMKEAGITPIGIGTRQNWPAAAWFDYINLRMNGLDFHLELLSGNVSFHDGRVQKVLIEWKRLIDNDFFNEGHENYDWDGVLPFFYRKKIGFMLLGNFVASRWPIKDPLFQDIGFMPFPSINKNIPIYEDAPTDVFMIPKSTTKVDEAKAFLRFIARADVPTMLNKDLGYLPPNKESTVGKDRFVREGAELINGAAGLAQYFDRDTSPAFDHLATPLLADYLSTGNIEAVTEGLEAARIMIFGFAPAEASR